MNETNEHSSAPAALQLREGARYRTRNGSEAGPLQKTGNATYTWSGDFGAATGCWTKEGYYNARCPNNDAADLVEELPDVTPSSSNGGPTQYYDLPEGATQLNDLIEAKQMSFARGNCFKAIYRLGEKPDLDPEYDLNKIVFFVERMRGMLKKGEKL